MKFFSSILLFVISTTCIASDIYSFDNNRDGRNDAYFFLKSQRILQISRDINYDGKIDWIRSYKYKKIYYTEKSDSNFDGIFEKIIEVSKVHNGKQIIKHFEVIGDTRTLISTTLSDAIESKEDFECYVEQRENLVNEVEQFIKNFNQILEGKSPSLLSSGPEPYYIDKSCSQEFGESRFQDILADTHIKGLACLRDLAKEEIKSPNQIELFNLLNIMDSSRRSKDWKVTVTCGEDSLFEGENVDVLALASIAPSDQQKIKHPFVAFNPKLVNKKVNRNKISSILFHETLHNYGYSHGEGIDLAYGCEVCCFNKQFSKEAKVYACNICKGNYETQLDKNYLLDISLLRYHTGIAAGKELVQENYKKLNNSKELKIALITRLKSIHPEVLYALFKENDKMIKSVNQDLYKELRTLKYVKMNNNTVTKNAKITSEIIKSIFLDKDVSTTKDLLSRIETGKLIKINDKYSSMMGKTYSGGKALLKDLSEILYLAQQGEDDLRIKQIYIDKRLELSMLGL